MVNKSKINKKRQLVLSIVGKQKSVSLDTVPSDGVVNRNSKVTCIFV